MSAQKRLKSKAAYDKGRVYPLDSDSFRIWLAEEYMFELTRLKIPHTRKVILSLGAKDLIPLYATVLKKSRLAVAEMMAIGVTILVLDGQPCNEDDMNVILEWLDALKWKWDHPDVKPMGVI